jgi:hypothetical protein
MPSYESNLNGQSPDYMASMKSEFSSESDLPDVYSLEEALNNFFPARIVPRDAASMPDGFNLFGGKYYKTPVRLEEGELFCR